MEYLFKDDRVIIKNPSDFSLLHTFDCGQCFRFNEVEKGRFTGVAFKKPVEIYEENGDIVFLNLTKDEFLKSWVDFLDLDRDYKEIKDFLSSDEIIKKAIGYGEGIRILKQDFFESLLSFIISQRSSIPKIKGCIEKISAKYGEEISLSGKRYYTFPDAETLRDVKEKDYAAFGVGYRAKYLEKAVFDVLSGKIDEKKIRALSTVDARNALLSIFGVGNKVADCVLLFGLSRFDSFPVDVWVKRAMDEYFEGKDGFELFGEDSGFAQQYLFYKMRNGSK